MKLSLLTDYLESLAPLTYQEDYDNAGLIVGKPDQEVNQALISLDCTEAVVDEAIANNCQFIISHHPIVFRGVKKFNGKTYVERVVEKAIRANIGIYAIHTNLDNIGTQTAFMTKVSYVCACGAGRPGSKRLVSRWCRQHRQLQRGQL
jgi:putative NIF3 family GTP cyclohydrolase 1 type 2